jgi:beta-glucuronidase
MDVISFNRYNAWYVNSGRTDTITQNVKEEALNWHEKYNKPVLMTEYGGDTMAGLHSVSISKGKKKKVKLSPWVTN